MFFTVITPYICEPVSGMEIEDQRRIQSAYGTQRLGLHYTHYDSSWNTSYIRSKKELQWLWGSLYSTKYGSKGGIKGYR